MPYENFPQIQFRLGAAIKRALKVEVRTQIVMA